VTLELPENFFNAMMEKFELRAKEKDRSLEPWKDYSTKFLLDRLRDELIEFAEAITPVDRINDEAAAELLDVANFCMFLWLRWQRKGE